MSALSGARPRLSLAALLRELPPHTARRVSTPDGVSVAVQDWNATADPTRQSMLLLHGYCQSHQCWLRQLASPLSSEFHLVSVDLRGHGDSDKPPDPAYYRDPRRWADEVRVVIEACALERPVVMAWSYAGRVVLDYLSVHGEAALGGLVMVSASSSVQPRLMGSAGHLLEEMSSPDPAQREESTRELLLACAACPLPADEFEFMYRYNDRVPPQVREALRGRPAPYEPVLRALTLPTLVIHGDLDPVNLPAMSAYTASCVRDARSVLYHGVSHMPFWEEPERFNADVAAFLRGLR